MCTCGCAEILGECNHVGCPNSTGELPSCARASPPARATSRFWTAFAAKYGAIVLAAPTTQGFDLVAWIAPFAVFAAALLGTILLVRRWAVGQARRRPPPQIIRPGDAMRSRKDSPGDRQRRRVLSHD